MKVNVELDFDDFFESFNEESIVTELRATLAEEVHKKVKRHPMYKMFIEKQTEAAIKKMMETA